MPGHVALIRLILSKLSRRAPGRSFTALLMRRSSTASASPNVLTLERDGFARSVFLRSSALMSGNRSLAVVFESVFVETRTILPPTRNRANISPRGYAFVDL